MSDRVPLVNLILTTSRYAELHVTRHSIYDVREIPVRGLVTYEVDERAAVQAFGFARFPASQFAR